MPESLFFNLSQEKQQRIIGAGISEFAAYGYTNSSTNRIVTLSGISKGSLFQYFTNKEELYFFILDTVTSEFLDDLGKKTSGLSKELFERVIAYSALEFSWYIQNPKKAKLILGAFTKSDGEIYQKTIARYGGKESDIFYSLTADIDLHGFRPDRQKTTDILRWVLKGFNESFLEKAQMEDVSIEEIQKEYTKSLTEYLELLQTGLLQ